MKHFILFLFIMTITSPAMIAAPVNHNVVILENIDLDTEDEFTLLTNPVKNGVLKLRVNKTNTTNVAVTIINSLGEQVFTVKSAVNKQVMNFDVSKLAAGIYFLRISSDDQSIVKKLIIQ
ncbi:T9SS type A sorting domain-containing protein [Nonlabens sp.]|uniref:T9SS type A sorting domain-containing protein n=1 Tax=Nonlabens sp. TaxID=1888209 RepID=UPI003F6A0E8E